MFDVCESIWGQFTLSNESSTSQVQPLASSPRLGSTADVLPAAAPAPSTAPIELIPAPQFARAKSQPPRLPSHGAAASQITGTLLVARKKNAATGVTLSGQSVVRDSIMEPSCIAVKSVVPMLPLSQSIVPAVVAQHKAAQALNTIAVASHSVATHDATARVPIPALEGVDVCSPILSPATVPPMASAVPFIDAAEGTTTSCLLLLSTGFL